MTDADRAAQAVRKLLASSADAPSTTSLSTRISSETAARIDAFLDAHYQRTGTRIYKAALVETALVTLLDALDEQGQS